MRTRYYIVEHEWGASGSSILDTRIRGNQRGYKERQDASRACQRLDLFNRLERGGSQGGPLTRRVAHGKPKL